MATLLALPASAAAAPVVASAAIHIGIGSPVSCEVTMALRVEGATEVSAFLYGKAALLVYAAPAPALRRPSGGYTFAWNGMFGSTGGVRIKRYEKPELAVMRIEAESWFDMKLVDVEWQFDSAKVTFYFTAEKRVDFRELVKDLASELRTRIELRQIGVRDEAKRRDGFGSCGRRLCCSSWLREFQAV